ncbi:CBN-CUT-5 protein [Caenorhabditis brenneri]|uniref:CBN-CUT-5 protein n=1 Tax=Caenorhabditis brenneri TaxID=135651 RepID=G0MHR5_CAEBE|nr:CBN-CUT-5 protein [Caenorhabditis brenneri]
MNFVLAVFAIIFLQTAYGEIDNAIVGDPSVECGDDFFEVKFDTRTTFHGIAFVQNHLDNPDCRSFARKDDSAKNTSLRLTFDQCAIEKRHSTSPRGLFLSTNVVVAFNPEFLTKNDRVFKVQCFYMEMERRIQKEIQISMPPPTMHSKQLNMPVCKYEVLDGSPTGPPVYFATVGQMVYHKWTCDTEHENTFCMLVHSCFVDDGNGQRVQLLNEKGCALDKYLLTNLEYPTDLMAGREAHVYKYADRDNMYFDCQISITVKEPGLDYCDVPSCPDPPRRRRSNNLPGPVENSTTFATEFDYEDSEIVSDYIISNDDIISLNWLQRNFDMRISELCMTAIGTTILVFLNAFLFIISLVSIMHVCCFQTSPKLENTQSTML